MTQAEIILYGLIIFFALYFLLFTYVLYRMKDEAEAEPDPEPPPTDFKWPDEVELRYTDAAGNVVANQTYVIERPGQ